jgi:hypothetical protein
MQLAQGVRRLTEVPGRINGFCTLAWEVYTLHPPAALLVISGVETPSANELPPTARFLRKPLPPEKLLAELNQALPLLEDHYLQQLEAAALTGA